MKVNLHGQKNLTASAQQKQLEKQLKEVSQGMEEQFAGMLIQEMRKSIDRNEDGSTAMKIYESMLDQEYARILAEQGQLGLGDVIIKQLAPKINLTNNGQNQQIKAGLPGDNNDTN